MPKKTKMNPKPADASVTELEEQLAGARRLHEEDLALVRQAEETFDRDGTDKAAAELESAQAEARRSKLHIERAERLLVGAREREAEEERQRIEAELAQAEAEIAELYDERQPLAAKEAQALRAAIEARFKRFELERRIQARRDALHARREKLGLAVKIAAPLNAMDAVRRREAELAARTSPLSQDHTQAHLDRATESLADKYRADDPRRSWLLRLAKAHPGG